MKTIQSRRCFLTTLSSVGVASLIGAPDSDAQDARLETTTVRIAKIASICIAPQYVADDLLRAEGFTDIRYVLTEPGTSSARALARGEIDFTTNFSPRECGTGKIFCLELHSEVGVMPCWSAAARMKGFIAEPGWRWPLVARLNGFWL